MEYKDKGIDQQNNKFWSDNIHGIKRCKIANLHHHWHLALCIIECLLFTHTISEPSLLWGTDIGLIIPAASLSLCFLAMIVQKFGSSSFQSYSHLQKNESSKVSPLVISICKGSRLLAVQRVEQESSSLQDVLEYLEDWGFCTYIYAPTFDTKMSKLLNGCKSSTSDFCKDDIQYQIYDKKVHLFNQSFLQLPSKL